MKNFEALKKAVKKLYVEITLTCYQLMQSALQVLFRALLHLHLNNKCNNTSSRHRESRDTDSHVAHERTVQFFQTFLHNSLSLENTILFSKWHNVLYQFFIRIFDIQKAKNQDPRLIHTDHNCLLTDHRNGQKRNSVILSVSHVRPVMVIVLVEPSTLSWNFVFNLQRCLFLPWNLNFVWIVDTGFLEITIFGNYDSDVISVSGLTHFRRCVTCKQVNIRHFSTSEKVNWILSCLCFLVKRITIRKSCY